MTQIKLKIKKGDLVEVTTGKEKGKRGEIVSVDRDSMKVLVKGLNMVTRFAKQSAANPNGVFQKEMPLHISNVALVNTATDSRSKVGIRTLEDGTRARYFKNNGANV